MTDQSAAERLFIDTARRCLTEDSINAAPLVVEIMTAATNGNTDFVLAVANAAIAHVDDMAGSGLYPYRRLKPVTSTSEFGWGCLAAESPEVSISNF